MKEKLIIALLLLVILALPAVFASRLAALAADSAAVVDRPTVVDQATIERQQVPLRALNPQSATDGCAGGLYFTSNPAKCLGPDGLRVANEGGGRPFAGKIVPATPQP